MRRLFKMFITIILMLSIIVTYGVGIITMAAESDLVITPKPETNNIHLKWTGPQNSSYKVYQKKPGSNNFETIGLTDFSADAIDEEVKVLNVYPTNHPIYATPNVHVRYLDGQTEVIPKTALLKVWMEGRYCNRGK